MVPNFWKKQGNKPFCVNSLNSIRKTQNKNRSHRLVTFELHDEIQRKCHRGRFLEKVMKANRVHLALQLQTTFSEFLVFVFTVRNLFLFWNHNANLFLLHLYQLRKYFCTYRSRNWEFPCFIVYEYEIDWKNLYCKTVASRKVWKIELKKTFFCSDIDKNASMSEAVWICANFAAFVKKTSTKRLIACQVQFTSQRKQYWRLCTWE